MTIHSALHIRSTQEGFFTLAYIDNELKTCLKKIDTIIIDKIFIVSKDLLNFISNIFANIHNNSMPFSRINIILLSDLIQLLPVSGLPVFQAVIWSLFYSLFLTISH